MTMSAERKIICNVYETLLDESYSGIANIIDRCCIWAEANALHKVRYWLRYGLKHDGDYSGTYIGKYTDTVDIYEIKHAFRLLEDEIESFDYSLNKKIERKMA